MSCIYGTGSKEDYEQMVIPVFVGQAVSREQFLSRLVELQYNRNDITFERGQFRVRGDTIELCPAGREDGGARGEHASTTACSSASSTWRKKTHDHEPHL